MEKTDIVVLGGGVIGLSVALRMLNSGREVVLIDPEKPGSGTHMEMQALLQNMQYFRLAHQTC